MLANQSSAQSGTDRSSFSPGNWLSSISYRSRATAPLSDFDLNELVRTAQIRNRTEAITGMVIYDDGQFMQWLEGPANNLDRIVESINRDRRHTDIEILGRQTTPVRLFEGWDLKLARKHAVSVFPRAVGCLDHLPQHPEATPQAQELADRLMANCASVSGLVSAAATLAGSSAVLFRDVFEPAARRLGDGWTDDACTEFDVTMALVRLQSEMRRLNGCAKRFIQPNPKRILLVPQPGEAHMLTAVMNAEVLWQAGWTVTCDFPRTDRALLALLADSHFDALDISLSPALSRRHRLTDLAETVSRARKSSLNPELAIIASGRIFGEPGHRIETGADAEIRTAFDIGAVATRAIDRIRLAGHDDKSGHC